MREPDWQSENGDIKLYCGDCLKLLPEMEPGSVDAVVTDPPYGINVVRGGGLLGSATSKAHIRGREYLPVTGDDRPFDPTQWLQFQEVILWGGNWFADRLPPRGRWLVWDKRNGTNSNNMADCELAWTSSNAPARLKSLRWMGMIRDEEKQTADRVHPTQKPVSLMMWCLQYVCGDIILDPYMGSGTTAVACVKLSRRCIGIEIEPKYFEIAVKRVKAAIVQGPDDALFRQKAEQPEQLLMKVDDG